MSDKTETITIALPEGLVVNSSLFEKDAYDEKSTPAYKIELAFPAGSLDGIYESLYDAAEAEWGEGAAAEDSGLIIPIKDGDAMAAKREANGKKGDVYQGMEVIRATTIFNLFGQSGPGGIQVFGPDVKPIEPAQQGDIYNGIFGVAVVSIGHYQDDRTDNNGLKFYLSAFQKTKDGDRIGGSADYSLMFKKVGRTEGSGNKGRKSRAG